MRAVRPLAASLLLALVACTGATSGQDAATLGSGTTTSDAGVSSTGRPLVTVPAPAVEAITTTTTTAPPPSTVSTSPTTTTGSVPATVTPEAAPVCRSADEVTTPSGRRVVLRASGLTAPSPAIVVVHGYTGTPEGIEKYAELTELAALQGIAVAYPQGTATEDGGFGWNTGAERFSTDAGDDVAALREMVEAVVMTGCVDPSGLVLAGESNGGGLALLAACTGALAPLVARVVLVNAAVDEGVLARCTGTIDPAPLTAVAGALDATVPLDGGDAMLPVAAWFASASSSVARCVDIAAAPPVDAVVERTVGTGCAACSELLVVADGTHTWPGTSRGVSGLEPGSFDLNPLLVAAARTPTSGCLTGLP
jgi:polyhydroxybutyrate depolymerase